MWRRLFYPLMSGNQARLGRLGVSRRSPWHTKNVISRSDLRLWPAAMLAILLVTQSLADDGALLNPASWGSDHVGKQLPEYITGDECLFCHRDIGPAWNENRHQLTMRPADADEPAAQWLSQRFGNDSIAAQTTYLLGARRKVRFLKRSDQYGKLELLSVGFEPQQTSPKNAGIPSDVHWDSAAYADRCAGCHTTAVDSPARAFSALSLDCFTCHGNVPLEHTENVSLAFFSSTNQRPREVISICGQCHLRGGKSASTGLPYANQFVAGDNLFRDFRVDFSRDFMDSLAPGDRHIYENARDVVLLGRSAMTCLTCHDVHGQSSEQHQSLENAAICASCHVAGTDNSRLVDAMLKPNRLRTHSRVCDY